MKAFGYIRTSGPSQISGDGPERQRVAISKFAESKEIELLEFFEDKAIPGATAWVDRPDWMDLLRSLNGTSTIIVEGLDRLARELGVQEFILADLTKRGITLLSAREEDIQSSDPARVLFRQMLGSIYQFEKSLLVLKLRAARERKRATGAKCEGARAFGDLPAEEEAVAFMRTTSSAHPDMTLRDLADLMNRRGYPTRFNRRWHANTVARILRRVS